MTAEEPELTFARNKIMEAIDYCTRESDICLDGLIFSVKDVLNQLEYFKAQQDGEEWRFIPE